MKPGPIAAGVILIILGIMSLGMTGAVGYARNTGNGLELGYMACSTAGLIGILAGIGLIVYGAVSEPGVSVHPSRQSKRQEICPSCKNRIQPDFELCPYCGIKFKRDLYCTKCGKRIEPEFRVCPFCGNKL